MNADLDNPEVEYAAMPNNTEHREMIDLDVQFHEENEVEFVEDNDGEDEEEIFRASFVSGYKQQMVEGGIEKWPSSIPRKCARYLS